jgi:hypothetical protein
MTAYSMAPPQHNALSRLFAPDLRALSTRSLCASADKRQLVQLRGTGKGHHIKTKYFFGVIHI